MTTMLSSLFERHDETTCRLQKSDEQHGYVGRLYVRVLEERGRCSCQRKKTLGLQDSSFHVQMVVRVH